MCHASAVANAACVQKASITMPPVLALDTRRLPASMHDKNSRKKSRAENRPLPRHAPPVLHRLRPPGPCGYRSLRRCSLCFSILSLRGISAESPALLADDLVGPDMDAEECLRCKPAMRSLAATAEEAPESRRCMRSRETNGDHASIELCSPCASEACLERPAADAGRRRGAGAPCWLAWGGCSGWGLSCGAELGRESRSACRRLFSATSCSSISLRRCSAATFARASCSAASKRSCVSRRRRATSSRTVF